MERYLCIGGVEISNPARTLAYLANVGNRCIVPPSDDGCCTCCSGDEGCVGPSGSYTVTPSIDGGVVTLAGAGALTVAGGYAALIAVGTAPTATCSGAPTPPVDGDPGWSVIPTSPALGDTLAGLALVVEAPGSPSACTVIRLVLTSGGSPVGDYFVAFDTATGATWIGYRGVDAEAVDWSLAIDDEGATSPVVVAWSACPEEEATSGLCMSDYRTPVLDDAPWYDPADPRSADVLGVWLDVITLSSGYGRTVTDRRWGSSLGPPRRSGREMVLEGKVYVRTRAAKAYARQWLHEALIGTPCEGGCDEPDALLLAHCPIDGDNGDRTLHRVGLVEWDWDTDVEMPADCMVGFRAALRSEVPWLTKPADVLHTGPVLIPSDTPPFECPSSGGGTVTVACGCADEPARVLPSSTLTDCYATPDNLSRFYVAVTNPKLWTDGTLRITVAGGITGTVGEPSLRNLRIRGWANPSGLSAVDGDTILCSGAPCIDVQVGCVPYGATLIVDGAKRRAVVTLGASSRSASPYLSSGEGRFVWPEYSCGGLMLAIDADADTTAADSTITVETIEVERG